MIKIIERGTRTIVRCNECGCKFSYEDMDVVHGCVTCPQCGVDIPHHRSSTYDNLTYLDCIGGTAIGTHTKLMSSDGLTTNKQSQTMGIFSTPTIGIVEPNTAGVVNND